MGRPRAIRFPLRQDAPTATQSENAVAPLAISRPSATFQPPVTAPQSNLTDSAGDPGSEPSCG